MARKHSESTAVDSFNPIKLWSPFLPTTSTWGNGGSELERASSNFVANMVALNEECARFVKKRLECDADYVQELVTTGARTASNAFTLQHRQSHLGLAAR